MARPVEISPKDAQAGADPARGRQVSRVKRSVHARKKRRKVLKEAKGYYGRKHSSYRFAKEQVQRSGACTPTATGATASATSAGSGSSASTPPRGAEGMSYSELMHGLKQAGVEVNRKMLAEIAVNDRDAFRRFVELAREGALPPRPAHPLHSPGRAAEARPPFLFQ